MFVRNLASIDVLLCASLPPPGRRQLSIDNSIAFNGPMTYILYRLPMSTKRTRLSQQQLEALIRAESLDSSKVSFTLHAQKQMAARKITHACVLSTLRNGRIRRRPEPNPARGSLECRMEYFCIGRNVAAIVAVSDDDPDLVLVTAMYT